MEKGQCEPADGGKRDAVMRARKGKWRKDAPGVRHAADRKCTALRGEALALQHVSRERKSERKGK